MTVGRSLPKSREIPLNVFCCLSGSTTKVIKISLATESIEISRGGGRNGYRGRQQHASETRVFKCYKGTVPRLTV